MNITVINGTEVKGCTYSLKEIFLDEIKSQENKVFEFYLPKDMPEFCCGCKNCFLKSEFKCPHSKFVIPIWNSMLKSDLIIFAYPVYVLRTPGQVKALLDHLGCFWMVHRPDKRMFNKRAVILTQSIGAPNKSAQKDVFTSLTWLGISDIKKLGFGLRESIYWDEISLKRKTKMEYKVRNLAKNYKSNKSINMGMKVKLIFKINKMLHKKTLSTEQTVSADNQHWIDNGWLKAKEK